MKLLPTLTWRRVAQPLSLQRTRTLHWPSMGTAAPTLLPRQILDCGGGSNCLVCTGCSRSRSFILKVIQNGLTKWKYWSGIHGSTLAGTIQGVSMVPAFTFPILEQVSVGATRQNVPWFDPEWPRLTNLTDMHTENGPCDVLNKDMITGMTAVCQAAAVLSKQQQEKHKHSS